MVKAWKEQVVIPTYEVGKPEKNPMFLENRGYQGSSGVVYPYPVIERISDEKKDHTYNAVFLENEYLKIMRISSWKHLLILDLKVCNSVNYLIILFVISLRISKLEE